MFLTRSRWMGWSGALLALAVAGACGGGGSPRSTSPGSIGRIVTTTTTTAPPATTTTKPPPVTKAQLHLESGGLGAVPFGGTTPGRALYDLAQALGQPDRYVAVAPGATCGATHRAVWGNFEAMIDEPGGAGAGPTPGLVGWYIGLPGRAIGLTTDKGIGIGSTLAQIEAAGGQFQHGDSGPGFSITEPNGVVIGELNGRALSSTVINMQSGSYCGQ